MALQKKLILQDGLEYTLLKASFKNGDKSVTALLLEITESVLKKEEIDMIDYLRENGLLNDFILLTVVRSKELFEKFSSKVGKEEFKGLLLNKTSKKRNVLHCLLDAKNLTEAEVVLNLIVERLNTQQVEKLLFEEINGGNVFHHAADENKLILIEILRWCRTKSDPMILEQIFIAPDDKMRRTLMHVLASHADERLMTESLKFLEDNFSRENVRKMLSIVKYNEIPLQKTLNNPRPKVVKLLYETYCEIFLIEELGITSEEKASLRLPEMHEIFVKISMSIRK